MKNKVLTIHDSVHERVQKLLPWFVVDTLHGEELALVNQHLNVCPECQADFAWQCKLKTIEPVCESTPDVDRAFAKLRERIDLNRSHRTSWLKQVMAVNRPWMQWALAAQLVLILGLVWTIVTSDGNVAAYRALGANKATVGNMIVVFKPDTSEHELRRILNENRARIVDGPTVTDAYLLYVNDESLNGTLHSLRANSTVVLAEALSSRGTP